MKKKIVLGLIAFLFVAQFIRIDKSVPDVNPKGTFEAMNLVDDNTMKLLKGACYDCHSYKTDYPWYAEVAPLSWWLQGHINAGRDKLCFSIWDSYSAERQGHKIEETIEIMEKQAMPLSSYAIMHKEGRIDKEEADQIVEAFKKLR